MFAPRAAAPLPDPVPSPEPDAPPAAAALGPRVTALAELRVLAAGAAMGVLPAPRREAVAPLAAADRADRLARLLALWQSGCRRLVDETLYHDIAARHPDLARGVRQRLRRRAR